jgi:hypothetical protein
LDLGSAGILVCFLCASVGTKIDMAQIPKIPKGTPTRVEMERMFGKPMSVSLLAAALRMSVSPLRPDARQNQNR